MNIIPYKRKLYDDIFLKIFFKNKVLEFFINKDIYTEGKEKVSHTHKTKRFIYYTHLRPAFNIKLFFIAFAGL